MADARTVKTRASVKSALLKILGHKTLKSITMSEVAKEAGVSRSTLYANYPNLQDVFDDLVSDFHRQLQPLNAQLRCSGCQNADPRQAARIPFCRALRNAGEYSALVRDPSYLPSMLNAARQGSIGQAALKPYLDAGLTDDMAHHLFAFQMSACYTAALSVPGDEQWAPVQRTIDRFISGGLDALKDRNQSRY